MRVLSLLPAATEIVAALGVGESLVGVTHECDYPEMVRGLPRVTASAVDAAAAPGTVDREVRQRAAEGAPMFALLEERIAELRPEIVLTQMLCEVCAVSETDVRALAMRLATPPLVVPLGGTSLEGVFTDIGRLAEVLGEAERGVALVNQLRARMRAVHETLKAARAPRPRVAVIEWTDPIFAAGHWVPEMVLRAGGLDVLASPGAHSRVVEAPAVAAAGPEVVIVAPCGYDTPRAAAMAERLLAEEAWSWTRGRAVWAMDGNALLSRPGPRLVDGIETMAAIFNQALFDRPTSARAVRVS